jgi:nitrate reductase gamma subunit
VKAGHCIVTYAAWMQHLLDLGGRGAVVRHLPPVKRAHLLLHSVCIAETHLFERAGQSGNKAGTLNPRTP